MSTQAKGMSKSTVQFLIPTLTLLMFSLPLFLCGLMVLASPNFWIKALAIALSPAVYAILFLTTTIAFSQPFHKAIVSGKFPRDVGHLVYGPRRLYGLCWGAIFYFTPLYYCFLNVEFLRRMMLRGFGYKGHLNVSIAPDAWIRDLPVLHLEEGVYIANKSTIGTNICLATGHIFVDKISLGERSMVGHLAMLAPGCKFGKRCEIGVGSAIGIRVQLGDKIRIAPTCAINHGVVIEDDVEVGAMSFIGLKARISKGIKLPGGSNIPEGASIESKEDVSQYLSSEMTVLHKERQMIESIYNSRVNAMHLNTSEPKVAND